MLNRLAAFFAALSFLLMMMPPAMAGEQVRALHIEAQTPQSLRQALVIGNSEYRVSRLSTPVNDARLIADALRLSGFSVTLLDNADRAAMLQAIARFGEQLDRGGVGLFYYAGHGLQVKGENWLIPVDADIRRDEDVLNYGVNLQQLLDRMQAAKNPLNIVFLDACRNNPYSSSTRGLGGLARLDAGIGTLIAFSTAPGQVALDGDTYSPFAKALGTHLPTPGLSVETMLKRVRSDVRKATDNRQITWESASLEGDFYFVPSATQSSPVMVDEELRYWELIAASPSRAAFENYLQRYPLGRFADLARLKLTQRIVAPEKRQPAPAKLARDYFPDYQGVATLDDLEWAIELQEEHERLYTKWGELVAWQLETDGAPKSRRAIDPNDPDDFVRYSKEAMADFAHTSARILSIGGEVTSYGKSFFALLQRKELTAAAAENARATRRIAEIEALKAEAERRVKENNARLDESAQLGKAAALRQIREVSERIPP